MLDVVNNVALFLSPVHEEQSMESAGLQQGMRLVLEAGPAPVGTQMTLTFTAGHAASDKSDNEVIVDMKLTVRECLTIMRNKADLQGRCLFFRLHGINENRRKLQ